MVKGFLVTDFTAEFDILSEPGKGKLSPMRTRSITYPDTFAYPLVGEDLIRNANQALIVARQTLTNWRSIEIIRQIASANRVDSRCVLNYRSDHYYYVLGIDELNVLGDCLPREIANYLSNQTRGNRINQESPTFRIPFEASIHVFRELPERTLMFYRREYSKEDISYPVNTNTAPSS